MNLLFLLSHAIATITMCERNGEETKILLGCEDRTLVR